MPPAKASTSAPQWAIDLHGLKFALEQRSNRVISAIQDGEIAVIRSARADLEKLYPPLYKQFQAIPGKKVYLDIGAKHKAASALLLERYGATIFTAKPNVAIFHHLALVRVEGVKLVSAGKALSDAQQVAKRCGMPGDVVANIDAV